jgi:hypothetical protein
MNPPKEQEDEDCMRPKMRKNGIHRKLKVLGISPGKEASPRSGSGCARGQELEGIFEGAGSGRSGCWIYRCTFSIPVFYFVFRVPVTDSFEIEL